jgi:hypothetical protein
MRFLDLYRELARSSNLMEELQRAESEDAWIKAGLGQQGPRTSSLSSRRQRNSGCRRNGEVLDRVTEAGRSE